MVFQWPMDYCRWMSRLCFNPRLTSRPGPRLPFWGRWFPASCRLSAFRSTRHTTCLPGTTFQSTSSFPVPPGATGKDRENANQKTWQLKEGPLRSPSPWSLCLGLPPGSPMVTLPSRRHGHMVKGKLSRATEKWIRGHRSAHRGLSKPRLVRTAPSLCGITTYSCSQGSPFLSSADQPSSGRTLREITQAQGQAGEWVLRHVCCFRISKSFCKLLQIKEIFKSRPFQNLIFAQLPCLWLWECTAWSPLVVVVGAPECLVVTVTSEGALCSVTETCDGRPCLTAESETAALCVWALSLRRPVSLPALCPPKLSSSIFFVTPLLGREIGAWLATTPCQLLTL